MLIFLHGHLYGCQVTINSIYGLDMVAKKGLWWSTRVYDNGSGVVSGDWWRAWAGVPGVGL